MRVATIATLAALALTGQAFAAYTPKLAVQMGQAGTTIHLAIPPTDDPSAQLLFFAPGGTSANLGAPAGTTIGTVEAKTSVGDLGGATVPLAGTVEARAATGTYTPNGQPVPLATAAERCTGTAAHAAFWVLKASAAGQLLEVPLFVDPVSSPPAVAFSLTVCLPSSDVPASLGGAPYGVKMFDTNFTVRGVFTATTGPNVWRLRATPYTAGKSTPNGLATVESQSYVEAGSIALGTITRALTKLAATFTAAGKVRPSGAGASASVTLSRGATPTKLIAFARPAVSATGAFSAKLAARRGAKAQRIYIRATATAPARNLPASMCKATFGVPCVGATASGFTVTSAVKAVLVPKR